MEVKITAGNEIIIAISGRLDTNSSPEFESIVQPIVDGDALKVAVDCQALEYVSSSGLRQFLMLQKKISQKKGSLRLYGLTPAIKEIFNITGFSAIFKIE